MPGSARKEMVDPNEVGLYCCTSRCVRRAWLCGEDDYSGKNYDHRKDWMETLLTSVWYRIRARQARRRRAGKTGVRRRGGNSTSEKHADSWLSPVSDRPLPAEQRCAERGLRISDDPGLPMSLDPYLQLVDWTGKQLRRDKRAAIPKELADILQRLNVESSQWLQAMENFGQWFRRVAGRAEKVMRRAQQAGRRWFQGVGRCRQLFTPSD